MNSSRPNVVYDDLLQIVSYTTIIGGFFVRFYNPATQATMIFDLRHSTFDIYEGGYVIISDGAGLLGIKTTLARAMSLYNQVMVNITAGGAPAPTATVDATALTVTANYLTGDISIGSTFIPLTDYWLIGTDKIVSGGVVYDLSPADYSNIVTMMSVILPRITSRVAVVNFTLAGAFVFQLSVGQKVRLGNRSSTDAWAAFSYSGTSNATVYKIKAEDVVMIEGPALMDDFFLIELWDDTMGTAYTGTGINVMIM